MTPRTFQLCFSGTSNMKTLFKVSLFALIIWERQDGSIALTDVKRGVDAQQEAQRLKNNGSVASHYNAVAFDAPVPPTKELRHLWRWDPIQRRVRDDLPFTTPRKNKDEIE